jgi:hypothetical protein
MQSPQVHQKHLVAVRIARVSLGLYASKTLMGGERRRITSRVGLRDTPLLTYTSAFDMLQEAKWFDANGARRMSFWSRTALTRCWPRRWPGRASPCCRASSRVAMRV